jgi:hypothetical protein
MIKLRYSLVNVSLFVHSFFNKTLMVTLLCLTFIGQSMASSVMFYNMSKMNMHKQESKQMQHGDHQMMDSSDSSNNSEDNCCAKSCQCLSSGCFSAYLFTQSLRSDPIVDFSTKIMSNIALLPSQKPNSLYRPPIFS